MERSARVFAVAVVSGVLVAATAPADAAAHRPPWHVTIKASTATLTLGQKVVLSGKVNRSAAGKLVVLQERHKAGARWKDQANALVHRDGHYRVSDRPSVNNRRSVPRGHAGDQAAQEGRERVRGRGRLPVDVADRRCRR